jgi:hypothetical protein
MKAYTSPELEITVFASEDVITSSIFETGAEDEMPVLM